jgi:hypothetical protein
MVLRRRRDSDSHGHGRICQSQNSSPEELDYQVELSDDQQIRIKTMWPRVIPDGNLSLKTYWLVVNATSKPLRYDVVEEEFELWSYEEEETATLTAMEEDILLPQC